MSSNTLFGLSPTPTCATPTPTTATERGRWRKLLRCPYIRSRNLKSLSLCKNRRMNLGVTAEWYPSTPGLYREKSPTTSASFCSRSRPWLSTARPFMSVRSFTNGSSESCGSSTTTKSRCTAYLDRVLEHHFATFDEEITAWCRSRIQSLSRDLKTTLPWE